MIAACKARGAGDAQDAAFFYHIPFLNVDPAKMRIDTEQSEPVIEGHCLAIDPVRALVSDLSPVG